MLKKVIAGMLMATTVLFSFSFAVNSNQGGFGDSTKTSGVGVAGTGTNQGEGLLSIIKGIVNWVLGILALITLVILLWGGFQMVTAAGDDGKYKKGFTILRQAVIGLVFIGISWFMVSIVFSVIGSITGSSGE